MTLTILFHSPADTIDRQYQFADKVHLNTLPQTDDVADVEYGTAMAVTLFDVVFTFFPKHRWPHTYVQNTGSQFRGAAFCLSFAIQPLLVLFVLPCFAIIPK